MVCSFFLRFGQQGISGLPYKQGMSMQQEHTATFRFHGALQDFLTKRRRGSAILFAFTGAPAIKDSIEALGVPHPEVNVLLVHEKPVEFSYPLQDKDVVEVYPVEEGSKWPAGFSLDEKNPPPPRFVLDVHLGTLAKGMRMLGLDTHYQTDLTDAAIAHLAAAEERVVLTRDVGLLKQKSITWGYWLRSQYMEEQLEEVIRRYNLKPSFRPFARCLACNVPVQQVSKEEVLEQLPPKTRLYFDQFYRCPSCRRIYWKGSHYERMQQFIGKISPL